MNPTPLTRRQMLAGLAAGAAALTSAPRAFADGEKKRLGLADFSYIVRMKRDNRSEKFPRFGGALEMLEHLHELGYGGLQTSIRGWQKEFAAKLRDKRE